MQHKEITVHAGSTVPHPEQSYANFRVGVTLTATLDEAEPIHSSVLALGRMAREQCEILAREHREKLTADAEAERARWEADAKAERARFEAEFQARQAAQRAEKTEDDGIPF